MPNEENTSELIIQMTHQTLQESILLVMIL